MSEQSQVFLDRLNGRLNGEIDMATAPAAETDLLAMALRTAGSTLEIDCAGLTFIDSSGIHMLEHVAKRSGKRVCLNNVPNHCLRVLEIVGRRDELGIQAVAGRRTERPLEPRRNAQ